MELAPSEIAQKVIDSCFDTAEKAGTREMIADLVEVERDGPWNMAFSILAKIWYLGGLSRAQKEELKRKIYEYAVELSRAGSPRLARSLCKDTEQEWPMVLEYIREHGVSSEYGEPDPILADAVERYGKPTEIDQLYATYPLENDKENEKAKGKARKLIDEIETLYEDYSKRVKLPPDGSFLFGRLIPTAALQIKEAHYDLVAGIHSGGSLLPNRLHPIGQNVAYIEWHQRWEASPRLRNVHATQALRKGMRILLCENDAITGESLRRVSEKLERDLRPSSIDLCFTGMGYKNSGELAKAQKRFGSIFHITELDQASVFTDMIRYRDQLEQALRNL